MPGFIGQKLGMTRVLTQEGKLEPVTVISLVPNHVLQIKTQDKDGYSAYVVGVCPRDKFKAPGKKYMEIKEFKFDGNAPEKGKPLNIDLLVDLKEVSITGISKGKGFQGGIKRHNFSGLRATHGSKFIRAIGSTGTRKPRRTIKGLKMPGHMGVDQVTSHKRQVIRLDKENSLIAIKGGVPGGNKSMVFIHWK